jgi:[protein-PII] uridylyltransferase
LALKVFNFAPVQDLLKKIEAAAEVRLSFPPSATRGGKTGALQEFSQGGTHRLKLLHRAGAGRLEICQGRAAILDALVAAPVGHRQGGLVAQAQKEFPPIALVAIGGYGRAELNPHSDIDFMFLHDGQVAAGKPLPYLQND